MCLFFLYVFCVYVVLVVLLTGWHDFPIILGMGNGPFIDGLPMKNGDFPSYWECHHPNCYSLIFFRGVGWNHQPAKLKKRLWSDFCIETRRGRVTKLKRELVPISHLTVPGQCAWLGWEMKDFPCEKQRSWQPATFEASSSRPMKVPYVRILNNYNWFCISILFVISW